VTDTTTTRGPAPAEPAALPPPPWWRRLGVPDVLAVSAITLALYAAFDGGVPTRDPWHTLLWGAQLAAGELPDYQTPFAPTPHPLLILLSAVLSPLGRAAEVVLLVLAMAGLGAIAVGLFRLGERLYAWPVGLLAAAIVLTRTTFLYYGARAGVDVLTLALIVWAAVLEARRPRRGAPVLVLLLLAGLLRPEAWLFAAAYWLWLAPGRGWRARAGLAALAAAPPLLWALSDLVVTGDPLWSLHGTQSLASELGRRTGLAALPETTWDGLRSILAQPGLLLVSAAGLAAGLALFRRATALPVAILLLDGLAFLGLAISGLPLNTRYLLPAGLVLALFAALAALGWSALPRGRRRLVWTAAGIAALLFVAAVSVPRQPEAVADLRDRLTATEAINRDLAAILETAQVRRELAACGPLVSPNVRLRPQFAFLTGRDEGSVAVVELGPPPDRGVLVRTTRRGENRGRGGVRTPIPESYRPFARSRSWVAYSGCDQATGTAE